MSESLKEETQTTAKPKPARAPNDLLAAAADGDKDAFALFYNQVAETIFATVRTVLGEGADVEAAAQDALVELWRTAPSYSPARDDAIAWAMALAHHHAIDRLRSQRMHPTTARDAVDCASPRPFDQIAEVDGDRESRRQLRRALAHLTSSQRETIMQAYYRGLTCQEIADDARLSHATVTRRLRDGLIRLRDTLAEAR